MIVGGVVLLFNKLGGYNLENGTNPAPVAPEIDIKKVAVKIFSQVFASFLFLAILLYNISKHIIAVPAITKSNAGLRIISFIVVLHEMDKLIWDGGSCEKKLTPPS